MSALDYWPRRADGLPPGQRQVRRLPRFSDKPLRWAPVPGELRLVVSVEGDEVGEIGPAEWGRFDRVDQVGDLHCVTTWSYRGLRWSGFRFVDVVRSVVDGELAPYLVVHALDRQSAIYVTEDLDRPDVLLATHLDGEPLSRRHGAPLRLVSPGQYGYKNVKHVVRVDFRDQEPASTLGPKEHLRARVAEEERHSRMPNWAVRVPYRLTVVPTALAADRGLRRSPDA
ncbi:MAG: molybdopterin-dependent oxidoreductase [Actinomycetota bacterium]